MSQTETVRLGDGMYAVTIDGRREIVYVARDERESWASCRGEVFRETRSPSAGPANRRDQAAAAGAGRPVTGSILLPITAPMPATVLKVLTTVGALVKKGETLVILEAMKMELPLRASSDASVKAVRCQVGELVQPDAVLIELA